MAPLPYSRSKIIFLMSLTALLLKIFLPLKLKELKTNLSKRALRSTESILNSNLQTGLQADDFLTSTENECKYIESLPPGARLEKGEYLCASNNKYKFGVSPSGHLTLMKSNSREKSLSDRRRRKRSTDMELWSTGKSNIGKEEFNPNDNVGLAVLQKDGNLVARGGDLSVLWSAKTTNKHSSIVLKNNGILENVDTEGHATPLNIFKDDLCTDSTYSGRYYWSLLRRTQKLAGMQPIKKRTNVEDQCVNQIYSSMELQVGQYICSANKKYQFGLMSLCPGKENFDLIVKDLDSNIIIWSAGIEQKYRKDNLHAVLQENGHLYVRNARNVMWASSSKVQMNSSVRLFVKNDGIATIADVSNGIIWTSKREYIEMSCTPTIVINQTKIVDSNSLYGKVMAGYQGWFGAELDQGNNKWTHWSRKGATPSKDSVTIDVWPDLREFAPEELYPTDFSYNDGTTATLYSSYNSQTVERHFHWMQQYNVDGVFAQRFIKEAVSETCVRDKVLKNVRRGAEKYGRVFSNMYDVSGSDPDTLVQDIINDWMHLVDDLAITQSRNYLYHKGRPLVAIWGFGFDTRPGEIEHALELIEWFHFKAKPKYQATLMGGVSIGWRDLSRASRAEEGWAAVYRKFDVLSPWTVGRYTDIDTIDRYRFEYMEGDIKECELHGIDYMPVVFPGFSMHNLKPTEKDLNEIPRNGGTFLWHQLYSASQAGSKMVYVAMFDEVDEGTAVFKLAETIDQVPVEREFVTLDADSGFSNVPSDWYLQLIGKSNEYITQGMDVPRIMPQPIP